MICLVSCRYRLLFYASKLRARPLQADFLCTDSSFLQSQQDQSKLCSGDALILLELASPGAFRSELAAFKYKGTSRTFANSHGGRAALNISRPGAEACGPLGYLTSLLVGDAGVVKSGLRLLFEFILSWCKPIMEEKHGQLCS